MGNQHPPHEERKAASDGQTSLAGLKTKEVQCLATPLDGIVTRPVADCQHPSSNNLHAALISLIEQARRLADIDTANDAAHFAIMDAIEGLGRRRAFGVRLGDPGTTQETHNEI